MSEMNQDTSVPEESDPAGVGEGSDVAVLPVAAPKPRPVPPLRPRPQFGQLLAEHNPFYLLSAACMLASCLALTNSLSWIPIATTRLITLIVTLNVYEFALLGIALFLVARRGLQRDGRVLLMLQAFFLADFTFLNAEIATADLATGAWVNAILFVLAGVKIGLVIRVLRPAITPMQLGFVLLQLAVLFAAPVVMRWHHLYRGELGPREFYVLWWFLALLPVVAEALARLDGRRSQPASVAPRAQAAPVGTYLGLPYASLLVHIAILHYVYDVRFYAAHAAPLLLGLTIVLQRAAPSAMLPRRDLTALRLLLPPAAVLVSLGNPFAVGQFWVGYTTVSVTPLTLTVAAGFLVYVYCFLRPHAAVFLTAGAVAMAFHVFGPSRRQIGLAFDATWDWIVAVADRLTPKTLSDWGVVGLVASFAFLGIGFWVSLRKRPAVPEPTALTPGSEP